MKNSDPVSQRQKKYLLAIRRNSILIQVSRILLFVFFVGLWEVSARTGLIDSFIFSSPGQIIEKMGEMLLDHTLIDHVSITLLETLISFALVTVLGIGCGVLLWAFPRLSLILEPYLVVLNSLPKSALAPLLIVWLGSNLKTIVLAGISVAVFGAIMNLYTGFCETDPDKLKLIRTFGGAKKDELLKSDPSRLGSSDLKRYESKYRPFSHRHCDWRNDRQQKRPGLSDHLFQPGFPAHHHDHGHCDPLRYGDPPLRIDQFSPVDL